jgi:undecaprenyl diphosphate synthase
MDNQITTIPENIGLIMDGNGRWAQQNHLSRTEGHTKGIENMMRLLSYAFDNGVKTATCFALSTENLKRDQAELDHILSLIGKVFDYFVSVFSQKQISISYVGNIDLLPEDVQAHMRRTEEALSVYKHTGKKLYVAIAYGGRDEIIRAVNSAVQNQRTVTEADFLSMLSIPVEPDLLIRTGGEKRISNFMLYQASYSELYFSDKMFPDFSVEDLVEAFEWYSNRQRKFGLVK